MTIGKILDVVRLGDDVVDILSYLPRLAELLPPGQGAHADEGGGKPGKISGSPPPWNAEVAACVFDIAAGARRIEAELRYAGLGTIRPRGGADSQTFAALAAIVDLARLVASKDPASKLPHDAAHRVGGWARNARRILDELRDDERPWTRAPGGLRCPNPREGHICDQPLWLAPGALHEPQPPVYCRKCRNDDGTNYSWPHGAWVLTVSQAG